MHPSSQKESPGKVWDSPGLSGFWGSPHGRVRAPGDLRLGASHGTEPGAPMQPAVLGLGRSRFSQRRGRQEAAGRRRRRRKGGAGWGAEGRASVGGRKGGGGSWEPGPAAGQCQLQLLRQLQGWTVSPRLPRRHYQ